jgi:D-tyrosyl-tRNA(Tyr) deacylase
MDAGEHTRADVMRWWEEGWTRTMATLDALRPDDLERTVTVEGKPFSVLEAVQRQLAHYAYHGGQIVFLAKHFRGADWKSLSIPKPGREAFQGGDPIRPGVGTPSR